MWQGCGYIFDKTSESVGVVAKMFNVKWNANQQSVRQALQRVRQLVCKMVTSMEYYIGAWIDNKLIWKGSFCSNLQKILLR